MKLFLIICFVGVPLTLLFLVIIRVIFKKFAASMNDLVAVQFHPEDIIMQEPMANFFGQESKGMGQVRGNGALILTRESLHFILLMPRRSWEIPLGKIGEISSPESHLGKSKLKPLLRIDYECDGSPDAIAWMVADLDAWKNALEEAISSADAKDAIMENPEIEG